MLGIQVINQSVEKGSMPLGGDMPRTSLNRRTRRARLRSVSVSSTCRRAPSSISSTASCTCSNSLRRLFRVAISALLNSSAPGGAARHQQRGVKRGQAVVPGVLRQLTELFGAFMAEMAEQLIAAGQLDQLVD